MGDAFGVGPGDHGFAGFPEAFTVFEGGSDQGAGAVIDSVDDVVFDKREGVFGHKVTMLDFSPKDLEHFRKIGRLVEFHDIPGKVETALALSGSAAQSKIQTYPGDADYFERINNDNRIQQNAIEIVYFELVTDFKISYVESQKITESYQKPKTTQRILATIFVCESDLAYGIGRMLQTYHSISNPEHKVTVVRSKNELEDIMQSLASHSI